LAVLELDRRERQQFLGIAATRCGIEEPEEHERTQQSERHERPDEHGRSARWRLGHPLRRFCTFDVGRRRTATRMRNGLRARVARRCIGDERDPVPAHREPVPVREVLAEQILPRHRHECACAHRFEPQPLPRSHDAHFGICEINRAELDAVAASSERAVHIWQRDLADHAARIRHRQACAHRRATQRGLAASSIAFS
jgi:hypothetical protein